MKTLGRLKTAWSVLCVLFICLGIFNFMMPDSYSDGSVAKRLFYWALAVLFGVASISFRAVIKAFEETKYNNIK